MARDLRRYEQSRRTTTCCQPLIARPRRISYMTRMHARTWLIAVVGLAGTARAETWRPEGGFGIRFGGFTVDGVDTGGVKPFHIEGGVRDDRLLLFAEYQLASIDLPADSTARGEAIVGTGSGLVHRLGGHARYCFGRMAEHDGGADVWLEGGVGIEHMQWDAGGAWTRPDLAFGFGTMVWGRDDDRHGGLSMGLRMTLARRDDVAGAAAVCSAPCDMATTPTGWDRSILFDLTLIFGK